MIPIVLLAVFAVEVERAGLEPAEARLLAAQIVQESSWRPEVCSPAGACGLAQFMPRTWAGAEGRPGVAAATDPSCAGQPRDHAACAIRGQIAYMRDLLRANRSAETAADRWDMAWSSYNGGLGWVRREAARCAAMPGCRPGRWPANLERVCLRSLAACEENKSYPRRVRDRAASMR